MRLSFFNMENTYINRNEHSKEPIKEQVDDDKITVRALLSCPNCGYQRSFTNTFKRSSIELLTVSLKIFEWLTCDCGALIDLTLEFNM